MLVLSRKHAQTINLPELNVSFEVLQIKGNTVRIGIDAPAEIKVLRGELQQDFKDSVFCDTVEVFGANEHEIRNKLNLLNVAIAFAKKLIRKGDFELAGEKLKVALEQIKAAPIDKEPASTQPVALLVEDSDNERELLAGFLELHGYVVQTARDGLDAISFLESHEKPDLILMDIRLPRMSGADTIRRIRENPAFDNVAIFAVSGETPAQAGINPAKNRVAKWFQKPLQPSQLLSAIEQTSSAAMAYAN